MGQIIEQQIAVLQNIANNNSIGYCNDYPYNTGQRGYDCGAFISKGWQEVGVFPSGQYYEPMGSGANYNLYNEELLTGHGFQKIRYSGQSNLIRGDVLCSGGHTVEYLGNGRIIHAKDDYDGQQGDSQGNEILEENFYDIGQWCYVFRFVNDSGSTSNDTTTTTSGGEFDLASLRSLKKGDTGNDVSNLQALMHFWKGYDKMAADGIFGDKTDYNVRDYQSAHGLQVDGVVGPITWKSLLADTGYEEP